MTRCCSARDGYSQRQWNTFVVLALSNFSGSLSLSPLALLYPPIAKLKELQPTYFGIVFGSFSLSAMIFSLFCAKFINQIGPKFMFVMGMFVRAMAVIAFGFLIYIDDTMLFFGASLTLRIVSSLGISASVTARNSIIAKEFLNNAGFSYSLLEVCLGFGLMAGPMIVGTLMEYGGFLLPFTVLGIVEFLAFIVSVMLLPKQDFVVDKGQSDSSITKLLLNPKIILFSLGVLSAAFNRGFYDVALSNHLHMLGLTPVLIGSMFMLRGGTLTLSSPVIGFLCDKVMSPLFVVLFAASFGCIGFLFLGPVPFIPLQPSVTLCIIALSLLGIGGCGELVGGYSGLIKAALDDGLPDNIVTYGLVSGILQTAYYLGDFLGPIITGAMIDSFGFGWSSTVILSLHFLVVSLIIMYLFYRAIYILFSDSLLEQDPFYCANYGGYGSIKEIYARYEHIDEAIYH